MTALNFGEQETPTWFALFSSCQSAGTSAHRARVASQLAVKWRAGVIEPLQETLQGSQLPRARGYILDRQRGHGEDIALLNQWCQARVLQRRKYRDIGDKATGV